MHLIHTLVLDLFVLRYKNKNIYLNLKKKPHKSLIGVIEEN